MVQGLHPHPHPPERALWAQHKCRLSENFGPPLPLRGDPETAGVMLPLPSPPPPPPHGCFVMPDYETSSPRREHPTSGHKAAASTVTIWWMPWSDPPAPQPLPLSSEPPPPARGTVRALFPCALPRENVPPKFPLARAERLNTSTLKTPLPSTYCLSLDLSPSKGGGAHRPLTALCPSSPSLGYLSLPTTPSFPLLGCAIGAPGLSLFHCFLSGPHGWRLVNWLSQHTKTNHGVIPSPRARGPG